jgi:hypothetical protein
VPLNDAISATEDILELRKQGKQSEECVAEQHSTPV